MLTIIPISERSIPAASIAFSPASAAASSKRMSSGHQRRSRDPGELLEQPGPDVAALVDVGELLVDPGGGDDLGSLDGLDRDDADVRVPLGVVALLTDAASRGACG